MKKQLFLLGLPMLLAGCQDDAILSDGVANGDGNISITISTDDVLASRSTAQRSSAAGGLTNVDFTNYDLRYQLGIYAAETTTTDDGDVTTYTQVIAPQTRTVSNPQAVTYSFNLTPGKQYVAVAWADFVTAGSQADLHYDTSDFTDITCLDDDDARLNDESRDAYAVSQSFEVGNDALNLDLTLKRLFAKLRIVTTDWNLEGVDKPNKVELTYDNCYEGLSLNIINTSKTYTTSTRTYTVDLAEEKDYQLNYDAADCNRTIAVDYLIDSGSGYSYAHFTLKTYNDDTLLTTKTVDTDIPLRSNWLTTVMGNLFSTNSQITVECDEMFDDEANIVVSGSTVTATEPESVDNVYYVSNAAELLWISENASSLLDATVKLTADIDLDGINWKPIITYNQADYETYYISEFDGQDHTIYNLYIDGDSELANTGKFLGLFGLVLDMTIKNVTLQNVSIINFRECVGGLAGYVYGNFVIENCTVNNFFARPKNYFTDKSKLDSMEVGGLIGLIETYEDVTTLVFKNCHANNVDIESESEIGGLFGEVYLGNSGESTKFEDCTVSNATLWVTYKYSLETAGSVIGYVGGDWGDTETIICSNCSSSNITYKYLEDGLLQLKSGDEGEARTITVNGVEYNYGPRTSIIGYNEEPINVIIN